MKNSEGTASIVFNHKRIATCFFLVSYIIWFCIIESTYITIRGKINLDKKTRKRLINFVLL
jgi:hypothetical protein